MNNYPLVRFVSEPSPTADVRFDLHSVGEWSDEQVWPEHDSFSLGSPTLEGDQDAYGADFGTRQLTFNLLYEGSKVTASRRLSELGRELVRRTNWLMFQLSATSEPVWFKTRRTAPSAITFDYVLTDRDVDVWGINVQLDADSFAYGALVTMPPFTINNDPAASTNPCRVVLPTIVGDAPAPVKIKASFNVDSLGRRMRFTMTPYDAGAAPAGPTVWPIGGSDGWGLAADVGASVTDGSFSGGSYRTVSFSGGVSRVFKIYGAVPAAVIPGQYRVLLRMARESALDQFEFVLDQKVGDDYDTAYGPIVQFTRPANVTNNFATWIDLGTHNYPFGAPMEVPTAGQAPFTPNIRLVIGKLYGNFGCKLDTFLLVPVDTTRSAASTTIVSDFVGRGPKTTEYGYWDGDTESYMTYSLSTNALTSAQQPYRSGGYLKVTPGADNVLHWLLQTSMTLPTTGDNHDAISHTSTVTLSYHPRWLNLAAS